MRFGQTSESREAWQRLLNLASQAIRVDALLQRHRAGHKQTLSMYLLFHMPHQTGIENDG
jgi:hypothetical protein